MYDEFDKELLSIIRDGNNKFSIILTKSKVRLPFRADRYRAVELRLQALRKAGKIKFRPRGIGWVIAD